MNDTERAALLQSAWKFDGMDAALDNRTVETPNRRQRITFCTAGGRC